MTTQTPSTAEIVKPLRIFFSQIFDSGSGSDSKTQDPAGVDTGSIATFVGKVPVDEWM